MTAVPDRLLSTIRSRLQKFTFSPLPIDHLAKELCDRRGLDTASAGLIASLASGRLGQALEYLDNGVLERQRTLMERMADLSTGFYGSYADLLIGGKDEGTPEDRRTRLALDFTLMTIPFRCELMRRLDRDPDIAEPELPPAFKHHLSRQSARQIEIHISRLMDASVLLARNVNLSTLAENLSLSLAF